MTSFYLHFAYRVCVYIQVLSKFNDGKDYTVHFITLLFLIFFIGCLNFLMRGKQNRTKGKNQKKEKLNKDNNLQNSNDQKNYNSLKIDNEEKTNN